MNIKINKVVGSTEYIPDDPEKFKNEILTPLLDTYVHEHNIITEHTKYRKTAHDELVKMMDRYRITEIDTDDVYIKYKDSEESATIDLNRIQKEEPILYEWLLSKYHKKETRNSGYKFDSTVKRKKR